MEIQAHYRGENGKIIHDGMEFSSLEELHAFCVSIYSQQIKINPKESFRLILYLWNTTQAQMDEMSERKSRVFGELERTCKKAEKDCGHCTMLCEQ